MRIYVLVWFVLVALVLFSGCVEQPIPSDVQAFDGVVGYGPGAGVSGVFIGSEVKILKVDNGTHCLWSAVNSSGVIEEKVVLKSFNSTNMFLNIDCFGGNWSGRVNKNVFAKWNNYVRKRCSWVSVNCSNQRNVSCVNYTCVNAIYKAKEVGDAFNKLGSIAKYISHNDDLSMYYIKRNNVHVYFNDSCQGFRKHLGHLYLYVNTACNVPTTWVYFESHSFTFNFPSVNNTFTSDSTPSVNFTTTGGGNTSCWLYFNGSAYDYNASVVSNTPTVLTLNTSFPDGTYTYQIQCLTENSSIYSMTVLTEYPNLQFTKAPANNSWQTANYTGDINVSISGSYIDTIKFNWNGSNTTFYNSSLVFGMNFDNLTGMGENYNNSQEMFIRDYSSYENNGMTATNAASPTYNSTGGKYGGAFMFDENNYVTITHHSSISNFTNLTISKV